VTPGRFSPMFLMLLAAASVAVTASPCLAQSLDAFGESQRDTAVANARAGQYQDAIRELEALRQTYPNDPSLAPDLATILAWAEEDAAAVALAASLEPTATPRYAQVAIAKAARNIQDFEIAAIWYDAALAASPEDPEVLAGRLLTAADAGDVATTRALLEATSNLATNDVGIALAHAYALRALGELLPALAIYDSILASAPEHFDALRGKALVLRALLLPTQALALAAAHPEIMSESEIDGLRADEAAVRARLAVRTPYPEPGVYTGEDRSLAFLDAQIAAATTPQARNTLLLDRVVALSDADRDRDAIAAFESLPPDANRDRPYVLTAAAKSYLQAREPETARDLLQRALKIAPDHLEARFLLVYAWLDLDRYTEAQALASELTAELPMTQQEPGSTIVKGNDNRIRAELVAGVTDADGNQLEAAQNRFESLLRDAPNNGELRVELANVYRWRGWLDRSLDEYGQVLTIYDDLLDARVGQALMQLDAREYAEVESTLGRVSSTYGREPVVQYLAESWDLHQRRELQLSASTGDSTGPVAGANYYNVDTRWYTGPLGYRYRILVGTHDRYAEYPEGDSRRQRLGAGFELRLPRFTATTEISDSRRDGKAGLSLAAEYRKSDYWTLSSGLENNSLATQLRAHRLGIESDRVYVDARFAPHERADLGFGFERADYSDDNALDNWYVDGRTRILNRPRSGVDFRGSVSLSRADSSDVPYFSPTRAGTLMLGLAHVLRLHRRYDRELRQTISVDSGRYAQHGFDTEAIWSAAYRIDWSISRRHALSIEAQRHGQYFDGAPEHTSVVVIALNSRF
jgi:biofilm PGA synthesis protein PgaA